MSSRSLRFLSKAYSTCSSASSRFKTLLSGNHRTRSGIEGGTFDLLRCRRVPYPSLDFTTSDVYDPDPPIFVDRPDAQSLPPVSDHGKIPIREHDLHTPWYDPYAANFEASIASAEEKLSLAESKVLPITEKSQHGVAQRGQVDNLESRNLFSKHISSVLERMNTIEEYLQAKIDHRLAQSRMTRLQNDVSDLNDGNVPTIGENDRYLAEQDRVYSSYLDTLRDVISQSGSVDERFSRSGRAYTSPSAIATSPGSGASDQSDIKRHWSDPSLQNEPSSTTDSSYYTPIASPRVLDSLAFHFNHSDVFNSPVASVDPIITVPTNSQDTATIDPQETNGCYHAAIIIERVPQHRYSVSTVFSEEGFPTDSEVPVSYGDHTNNSVTGTDQSLTQGTRSRLVQSIQRSRKRVQKFIGRQFNPEAVLP